jgi:hypothetical protein
MSTSWLILDTNTRVARFLHFCCVFLLPMNTRSKHFPSSLRLIKDSIARPTMIRIFPSNGVPLILSFTNPSKYLLKSSEVTSSCRSHENEKAFHLSCNGTMRGIVVTCDTSWCLISILIISYAKSSLC